MVDLQILDAQGFRSKMQRRILGHPQSRDLFQERTILGPAHILLRSTKTREEIVRASAGDRDIRDFLLFSRDLPAFSRPHSVEAL